MEDILLISQSNTIIFEKELIRFFNSSIKGEHRTFNEPFIVTNEAFQHICQNPHPDLIKVIHYCVSKLLADIYPNNRKIADFNIPKTTFFIAAAIYNLMALDSFAKEDNKNEKEADSYKEFTSALINASPKPITLKEMLVTHSILKIVRFYEHKLRNVDQQYYKSLIEKSPLTALIILDKFTPDALNELIFTLLPDLNSSNGSDSHVWINLEEWTKTINLILSDNHIARWIRYKWLSIPETMTSCRNIGLVLEALRLYGSNYNFILEFYESYEYFSEKTNRNKIWEMLPVFYTCPIFYTIDKLLKVSGDSEAAMAMNRRGKAYFLKFFPLDYIFINNPGILNQYQFLTPDFIKINLVPLLDFVPIGNNQQVVVEDL